MQTAEHKDHGQHAADALTKEGCPCHAGHTHVEGGDEQNVYGDVGKRGADKKDERRAGVAER